MVIAIIGERCTGKSALAAAICEKVHARVFTGRDYLELAEDPRDARHRFMELLDRNQAGEEQIFICIVTEHAQLALLPDDCFRVLCKSSLTTVKERFSVMLEGPLPQSISQMLTKQHGMFDGCRHHMTLDTEDADLSLLAVEILDLAQQFQRDPEILKT